MNDKTNKMIGSFLSSYVSRISENLVYDRLFQTQTAKLLQGLKDGEKLAIEAGLNLLSAAAVSRVEGNTIMSTIVQSLLVDAGPEIARRMRMPGFRAEEYVQENLRSNPKAVMTAFDEAFSRQPPVLTAAEYQSILDQHGYNGDSWDRVRGQEEVWSAKNSDNSPGNGAESRPTESGQQSDRRRWARDGLSRTADALRRRREVRLLVAERRSLRGRLSRLSEMLKRVGKLTTSSAKNHDTSN